MRGTEEFDRADELTVHACETFPGFFARPRLGGPPDATSTRQAISTFPPTIANRLLAKRRRAVVWRRRNPMDTRRTKRKHLHWIASMAFVALLAGPSATGAQPCVITFPGAPPSHGAVGIAYEQGISGSSPYLLIFYGVTEGTLPPGLNLTRFGNETWRIVGTPTA